jgi:hypothetical protein
MGANTFLDIIGLKIDSTACLRVIIVIIVDYRLAPAKINDAFASPGIGKFISVYLSSPRTSLGI